MTRDQFLNQIEETMHGMWGERYVMSGFYLGVQALLLAIPPNDEPTPENVWRHLHRRVCRRNPGWGEKVSRPHSLPDAAANSYRYDVLTDQWLPEQEHREAFKHAWSFRFTEMMPNLERALDIYEIDTIPDEFAAAIVFLIEVWMIELLRVGHTEPPCERLLAVTEPALVMRACRHDRRAAAAPR